MAEFQIEAVEADGLRVVRKGGYKKMELGWDLLDMDWLKANHPDLWEEKLEIEKAQRRAFEDYYFGDSKAKISQKIQSRGGLRVAGEIFGDTDPAVTWVCFDVEALNQFYRFQFDENKELESLEVHQSFDLADGAETSMKEEWERIAEWVNDNRSELVRGGAYNRQSDWRRLVRQLKSRRGSKHVTHEWEDARREFELAVLWREIEIPAPSGTGGEITFFGKTMDVGARSFRRTDWLVLQARLK
ncbi:MAG: hypothetical protein ACLFU4_04780 [Opitutales bacterium]